MKITELLTILKDGESGQIEFKEQINKSIQEDVCAFANTNGGRILIGVADDGEPVGIKDAKAKQEVSDLMQALRPAPQITISEESFAKVKIVIISVDRSSLLISLRNIVYIRMGTNNRQLDIDEIIEKSAESLRIFFDQIITEIPASNLSKKLFKEYLKNRESVRNAKTNGKNIIISAVKFNALKKKGKGLFLTNAGLLCFTEDPQKYINNAVVRLVIFDNDKTRTYKNKIEFSGPLPRVVYDLEEYFTNNLRRIGGSIIGFQREHFLEYPFEALREAIINAIIHRNYFNPSDVQICIFPQRIEIKNRGSFPLGVSIDNPTSVPRNPILAQYFYDIGLMEKQGSGLTKIITESRQHPLVDVEFVSKNYSTTVIFTKSTKKIAFDKINRNILQFLRRGKKKSSEIANIISLSRQATVARINELIALGFVKSLGKGPQTFYKLRKLNK